MPILDWNLLEAARLEREPFDHLRLEHVIRPEAAAAVSADFPEIRDRGSFSLRDARPGPVLADLIAELESDRFRALMARLFDVDLTGRATLVTLRGASGPNDGSIHTDSKTKILSLLLYLNPDWTGGEGQLRLLRDGESLDSVAVEIPATMGSLVVFRRCDNSWHGHTRYVGPRRVLQLNYLVSRQTGLLADLRHRASAVWKRRPVAA